VRHLNKWRKGGLSVLLTFFVLALLPWTASAEKSASLFEAANPAFSQLPLTQVKIGDHTLNVEIAASPQTMARGLMFRTFLPADQGMLFIFPVEHQASFWMKNTSIPLSIAYLDKDGKILEIHPLIPFEESAVKSKSDRIRYALEVNRDWFSSRNIKTGTQVQNLPRP
jgi:uncharacterized protein